MKFSALIFSVLLASPATAGNFATCLLDKMPGIQNDVAANAVYQSCIATHPGAFAPIKQGAGRGWFGYKTGADCTAEKAGATRSNRAAVLIGVACRKLYDEQTPFDPSTATLLR